MLKGFIDLVFRHDGRYYLLDYKSNWLGEDREAYTQQAMIRAMRLHRYDLQYQLYSRRCTVICVTVLPIITTSGTLAASFISFTRHGRAGRRAGDLHHPPGAAAD